VAKIWVRGQDLNL